MKLPGKQIEGKNISASLIPIQMPVVNILVNGECCLALINSGYSQSIVSTE